MRMWSLHPKYLDKKGLGGCWREGLLAQSVLRKLAMASPPQKIGYRNHSQLVRFKQTTNPLLFISEYLHYICDEADSRGYNYNRSKLADRCFYTKQMSVTAGQLAYERDFLLTKLDVRDKTKAHNLRMINSANPLTVHPLFQIVPGEIASWEKVKDC